MQVNHPVLGACVLCSMVLSCTRSECAKFSSRVLECITTSLVVLNLILQLLVSITLKTEILQSWSWSWSWSIGLGCFWDQSI